MKNKILNISLITILGFSLISCNDWLDDVKQTSTVSDEIVWKSEKNVEMNLNSFYTFLNKYGQFGTYQFDGSLTESLTDTYKYGSVALGSKAGHPNNYVINPDAVSPDGCYYSIWGTAYGNIRQINQFLTMQKAYSKFPEEKNLVWEAEARFFRAFVYFQLAKRHNGVIIYDALPESNDKALSSASDTWDFIEADLNFAIENLPKTWDNANVGRITKGAAYAFLSRVMLYAERWQKAYDAADAVEKLGMYNLESKYENAYKGGNAESILEFRYSRNNNIYHTFDRDHVPACDGFEFGALGTPTQEMVESYETAEGKKVDWTPWHTKTTTKPPYDLLEPRFKATILYSGANWKGKVMDCSVNGVNGEFMPYREQPYSYGKTTTGYFLRKLLDESLIDVKGNYSQQTWVEIRYAEVLLNKAEAAYRLNKMAEAKDAMNKVRARVGLPAKTSSGDEFFKDYVNERKVELAYEGQLFWDMRRWKLAHIQYNNYRCHGIRISGGNYEYIDCDGQDRKFDQKLYVLPIPTAELKNNALISQYDEWRY